MSPTWTRIKDAPTRLGQRVRKARVEGSDRWFELRATALERAGTLIDRAAEAPAVGRLAEAAGRLVDRQLDRLTAVPVEGWDGLNARDAIRAVATLDRAGLRAARKREAATKERKTVLAAIDARLAEPVAAEPAAA